jgi:predicted ATP-dependent endonuclease of OLD family
LKRKEDTLTVATKQGNKKHQIGINISAFEFLRATYPKLHSLKKELREVIIHIVDISASNVLALSPEFLRKQLNAESRVLPWIRNITFSIPSLIDSIAKNTETYNLFKDTLCDIMDFEDVFFEAKDICAPSAEHGEEFIKRVRTFAIKEKGTAFRGIERFSDGTLVVTAILAALLSESREGPILCIEELENCLHPAALEKLLGFLHDNADRWPVLITTHSPYLLNGVNPENVNVAVVDDKTGAAHCEKIKNNRELREYLNKGLMSFGDLLASNYDRFRE